jgi:DMSO/TMAO reductase YedYZ molybdopterin-dependent catalytic subunit
MKQRTIERPSRISDKTLTRRSVIEWLGKATVLTLSGELIAACTTKKDFFPLVDARSENDLDAQKESEPRDGQSEAGFPFYPGTTDQTLFDAWGERTVDPQDLTKILKEWRLVVDGMVERSQSFTFSDLLSLTRHDQVTDFHCVEGWSVYDVPWNGVHISEIFKRVKPLSKGSYLTLYSIGDLYLESIPIDVALEPKTMLAYGIDGSTIPLVHGFPLRLVVPRMLAYKNAKYLHRIEVTDKPIDGYWVQSGYPYDGNVPASRLRQGKY